MELKKVRKPKRQNWDPNYSSACIFRMRWNIIYNTKNWCRRDEEQVYTDFKVPYKNQNIRQKLLNFVFALGFINFIIVVMIT